MLWSLVICKLYRVCSLALRCSYSTAAVSQKTCVVAGKPVSQWKMVIVIFSRVPGNSSKLDENDRKIRAQTAYCFGKKGKTGNTVLPSAYWRRATGTNWAFLGALLLTVLGAGALGEMSSRSPCRPQLVRDSVWWFRSCIWEPVLCWGRLFLCFFSLVCIDTLRLTRPVYYFHTIYVTRQQPCFQMLPLIQISLFFSYFFFMALVLVSPSSLHLVF